MCWNGLVNNMRMENLNDMQKMTHPQLCSIQIRARDIILPRSHVSHIATNKTECN
jgi:hypothetical protein